MQLASALPFEAWQGWGAHLGHPPRAAVVQWSREGLAKQGQRGVGGSYPASWPTAASSSVALVSVVMTEVTDFRVCF